MYNSLHIISEKLNLNYYITRIYPILLKSIDLNTFNNLKIKLTTRFNIRENILIKVIRGAVYYV